jgi:hypothetical protein
MNTTKILNALPPHLVAKISKIAAAKELSLAEAVVYCLEGETTRKA